MTWTLQDQMRIDDDALFNPAEFGEAAIYTPPGGGTAVPVTVITAPLDGDGSDVRTDARRVAKLGFVPMADLTPVYRGTLTIAGEVWTIASAPEPFGSDWRMNLEQDPRLRLEQ